MHPSEHPRPWLTNRRLAALAGLAAMTAVTIPALVHHGFVGIFAAAGASWAGRQVFVDLVVVSLLAMAWMRADSRRSGRRFWPWALLTLAAGSFGPLLYLLSEAPAPSKEA